jgi:branched-chain amino acid transport system permease protein
MSVVETRRPALQAWMAGRASIRWPEVLFWLVCLLPLVPASILPAGLQSYWIFDRYLQLFSQIAITALFALSLDLILGYAGVVSLGHAAFFGLGAYAAGLISKFWFTDPLLGLAFCAVFAGLIGYLMSFVVLRFSGLALIMITLGFGQLLAEAANSASGLTGGADGLQGIRAGKLFGYFEFDIFGTTAYAYALGVLFIMFLLARRITNSPFGMSLRGIRENSRRMHAIGAPNQKHLRKVFTIAAAMAGVAGALLTQTTQTCSLETLNFQRSADVLVMLILGGVGRLYGAIAGAIIYMIARDVLSDVNPQYWYFWIGLLLIAVVRYMPNGLLGGLAILMSKWRRT